MVTFITCHSGKGSGSATGKTNSTIPIRSGEIQMTMLAKEVSVCDTVCINCDKIAYSVLLNREESSVACG